RVEEADEMPALVDEDQALAAGGVVRVGGANPGGRGQHQYHRGGERANNSRSFHVIPHLRGAPAYFPTRCSTSLLFSWQMYSISSPLRRVGFVVNVHVFENVFGSSMMWTISMWPKSVRVIRSVTFMSAECGTPAASIQVMSF